MVEGPVETRSPEPGRGWLAVESLLPSRLPGLAAWAAGLGSGAWLLSDLVFETMLGHPASTAGIVVVFVPAVMLVVAAPVWFALALVEWLVLRRPVRPGRRAAVLVLLAAWVLPTVSAWLAQRASADAMTPRVVARERGFASRFRPADPTWEPGEEVTRSRQVWRAFSDPEVFTWNGRDWTATVAGALTLADAGGAAFHRIPLPSTSSAPGRAVLVLPCALEPGRPADLAVLVDLRATSERAVLLVLAPDGRVRHHELLERHGLWAEDVLAWAAPRLLLTGTPGREVRWPGAGRGR